jgi:hypothetical protein
MVATCLLQISLENHWQFQIFLRAFSACGSVVLIAEQALAEKQNKPRRQNACRFAPFPAG